MNDLRVEVRFKNAVLYNALLEVATSLKLGRGDYPGVLQAGRVVSGVDNQTISALLCLRKNPWKVDGITPTKSARALADGLAVSCEELFSRELYAAKFPAVVATDVDYFRFRVSINDGEENALISDRDRLLMAALRVLSPKQEKVLRLMFGVGCDREHTLEEVAQEYDVSRERIRQIALHGLRALRETKTWRKAGWEPSVAAKRQLVALHAG